MPPTSTPIDGWIAEHYDAIRRTAWLLSGDPWVADDLAQETFLAAVDRWKQFEGKSSPKTWLIAILLRLESRRHRQLSRSQRRIRRWLADRSGDAQSIEDPAVIEASNAWQQSLWSQVAELPSKQRQALVLHYAEQMNYEEIGQALGCPEGTAKSRVHHGLERLRKRMQPEREMHLPPQPVAIQNWGAERFYE